MNDAPLTCHHCGFLAPNPYLVRYPNGATHVLCDSDCLTHWFRARQSLFDLELRQANDQLAADVNTCPVCHSTNLRDKGSFDKCMDCGERIDMSVTIYEPQR